MKAIRTLVVATLGTKVILGLALLSTLGQGCGQSPNPGRSEFVPADPTAPAPLDKGVRIRVDPNATTPTGHGDLRIDVDPKSGVDIKVEGHPIRDRLDELRQEKTLPPATP